MKIDVVDISGVKKRIDVNVPADLVNDEVKKAYSEIRATAELDGFRKGNVPISVLKKRFGDRVMGDVVTRMVETTYAQAIAEKGIIPVGRPKIEVKEAAEDKDFVYTAEVEVKPAIELNEYRGLSLKQWDGVVTDDDLEEGLKRLQASKGDYSSVDRASGAGDMVLVDLHGKVDGETVEGGKADDFQMIVGENALLPEFEESLMGVSKGDNLTVDIPYPDDYHNKELAGKIAIFDVTVKEIKEKVLPVLDDEFAKDLECESLEELKVKVKEEITKSKGEAEKERIKGEIMEKLLGAHTFEVPESVVERYLSSLLKKILDNMNKGMADPEDQNLSADELKEKYRDIAARQVQGDLILEAIGEKEGIMVGDDELDEYLETMASQQGQTLPQVKAHLEKEGTTEVIRDWIRNNKVFDLVINESKAS